MKTEPIELDDFITEEEPYNGDITEGIRYQWIITDDRNFSDIILEWIEKYKNINEFLKDTGLDKDITTDDIYDLISETKSPSKPLINYLSTQIPNDICSWLKFTSTGNRTISTRKDCITITEKSIAKNAENKIRQLATQVKTIEKEHEFLQLIIGRIEEIAEKNNKSVDIEKSLNNIAKSIGLKPEQLKSQKNIPADKIVEKTSELASLLMFEGEEFDDFCQKTQRAWLSTEATEAKPAYSQILIYLRQSWGLKLAELSKKSKIPLDTLEKLENATTIADKEANKKICSYFSLSKEGAINLDSAYNVYRKSVIKRFNEHAKPIIEHFSAYGLTPYQYFNATMKTPLILKKSPEVVISNITKVCDHFKNDGINVSDYLKAAIKRPQLFYQNPEVTIKNIETVCREFKELGLSREKYLEAAIKEPSLFSSSPQRTINNMNILIFMYNNSLVSTRKNKENYSDPEKKGLTVFFKNILNKPNVIGLSTQNLKIRAVTAILDKFNGKQPSSYILRDKSIQINKQLSDYLFSDRVKRSYQTKYLLKLLEKKVEKPAKKWSDNIKQRETNSNTAPLSL